MPACCAAPGSRTPSCAEFCIRLSPGQENNLTADLLFTVNGQEHFTDFLPFRNAKLNF